MALSPKEVGIQIGFLDESKPEHSGPFGRLTSLINGQVTDYVPAAPGVNQKQTIKQRNRFEALTHDLVSPFTGAASSGVWTKPRLLALLGDQPVSIDGAIPRIFNGQSWTNYYTNRVVTNKLEQSIVHTPNRTVQAPDSVIDPETGNQCEVWSEFVSPATFNSYCGFKASNGSWIRTPFQIASGTTTMQRVCWDGTNFWVTCPGVTDNTIRVMAFNVNGVFIDDLEIARNWPIDPGWWDCEAANHTSSSILYKAILAQPGPQVGTTEEWGVVINLLRVFSGAVATVQIALSGTHCNGPLAFSTNDLNALSYLATAGPKTGAGDQLYTYEITNGAVTHTYTSGVNLYVPDAITGYVVAGSGGAMVGVCISQLSEASQPNGPKHDPALRCVRVWETTRADVVTFIKQTNSVILQSRAFAVDGDYYAYTYYQSGGGLSASVAGAAQTLTNGDYMLGDPVQPLAVTSGDYTMGQASRGVDQMVINASIGTGTIAHNAGDSVDGSTGIWTLLNGAFTQFMEQSYLTITGSAISNNNSSYRIVKFIDATHLQTEPINLGAHYVTSEALAGVTAQVRPSALFHVAYNDIARFRIVPFGMDGLFNGSSIVVTGHASAPIFNGTYTVTSVNRGEINHRFLEPDPSNPGNLRHSVMGLCLTAFPMPGGTATGESAVATLLPGEAAITPINSAHFNFQGQFFDDSNIGQNLVLENAVNTDEHVGNNGTFVISDTDAGQLEISTTPLQPELLRTFPIAGEPDYKVSIQLASPSNAYKFLFALGSFDDSYRLAFVQVTGARGTNNGTYQITQVLGATAFIARPVGSRTGITNQQLGFADTPVVVTIFKSVDTNPALQPCWVMTPLREAGQVTVGRFDYGTAYADWRFDGDANPNHFLGALSTPSQGPDGKLHVVMPYRAQSFTAGQVAIVAGNAFSSAGVQQTTVGIKDFTLRVAEINNVPVSGQPAANSGELLIPGPQGSQFSASGFTEDGINFAFEQPFLISQSTNTSVPAALTPLTDYYQYVAVAEVTLEDGDRVYSIPSPALNVPMSGTNNSNVISGRLNLQTNHRLLAISLYRTVVISGVLTVEHYKITNDLDVNGSGFTFSSKGQGGVIDTWQFTDSVPDVTAQSAEQLYTDKGILPHYPAPAFSQGIGSAFGRTWLLGYDGAVWMSAEKTEGDAVWFNPNWRFTLPTDDKPVAIALLDDYVIVFCAASVWYVPKANFPNATNSEGFLPTPIQLPFSNGCTGFAVSIPGGVAYSSTAGGVWSITRNLTNLWLSEPIRDALNETSVIRGLTVDRLQRLYVAKGEETIFVFDNTSGGWWEWLLPTMAKLIATMGTPQNGAVAFQDTAGFIYIQQATAGADVNDATQTGAALDLTFANISLAGIRRFSHLWGIQIVGTWKGPHTLRITLGYPDEPDTEPTEFTQDFLTDPDKYIYEVNPMVEETSTFSMRIYAQFPAGVTPGDTFELELISAEVGVESGMNRTGSNKRIPSD